MPLSSGRIVQRAVTCTIALAYLLLPIQAQQATQSDTKIAEQVVKSANGAITRLSGTDASSSIQYVRLVLNGSLHIASSAVAETRSDATPPIFIAQCSLRPGGRSIFEMFAAFGGPVDLKFYPPWTPKDSHDLFPPATRKMVMTMEFLGYVHIKPFRRQWEIPVETPSLYRYNSPGSRSSNLEEPSWFLRYLASLPTLRLTLDDRAAEFETTSLLAAIRDESLCTASR